MRTPINNSWEQVLAPIFDTEEYSCLRRFLVDEYSHHIIYPKMENIFNALALTPPEKVKVAIIGQDPYINPNQAHGLAFSVEKSAPPPSLMNIFKEIKSDIGVESEVLSGNLTPWANQGVLLLNSVLTVRAGSSNSHKNKGWEAVTTAAIAHLIARVVGGQPIVFILWGNNAKNVFARAKKAAGDVKFDDNGLVLMAAHPSPLSAYNGFFGCKHFSRANEFLKRNNLQQIIW
ncbi:MAG: uracil-DNA glycosylase [Clostridiales bacterium]|nr:uracil-DNA glycosylase [Clostridiales bacterium]